MTKEQDDAIKSFLQIYAKDEEFLAALLVGSIAHGYSKPSSDIDIILVSSDLEFERRKRDHKLAFSLWDICEYQGGYVDCKVVSRNTLQTVSERGSDPARYAFKDAKILYSNIEHLEIQLQDLLRYPVEDKAIRRYRFLSQLLAWKWYLGQGEEKSNKYLITLAVQKIVLFSCRIILNENERIFPYHKWLLAETELASKKPKELLAKLDDLILEPVFLKAQDISDELFSFVGQTEKDTDWPNQFMQDSENNWLEHEAPIDDI